MFNIVAGFLKRDLKANSLIENNIDFKPADYHDIELDELFENINKLPSAISLKRMKDFHLKSLEIIAKLEIIENKYKGKSNGIKRND